MNLTVEIFNPLKQVEYDDKVFDPDYIDYVGPQTAIAFGLALRKAN
jgi:Tfp pilus assembly PilM family ATPase